MNPTIEKFGYPATLLKEFRHWLVLLRPAQVTLGSLVLAARSDATAYSQLPPEAFADQAVAIVAVEKALARFTHFERINYLMLMMVDPHVHFHVVSRYERTQAWSDIDFPDAGWPGPPRLDSAVKLDAGQLQQLVTELSPLFD